MQRVVEPQALPPPWEDDPLSKFMADADFNERACVVNYLDVYPVLQRAHRLLKRVCELLEKDPTDQNRGVPRMLIARSSSAFLAATRLAMSGQVFEARPVLRVAIEQAWYALHIAKDPAAPRRVHMWWDEMTTHKRERIVGKSLRWEMSGGHMRGRTRRPQPRCNGYTRTWSSLVGIRTCMVSFRLSN
jgi:hypothetical protein